MLIMMVCVSHFLPSLQSKVRSMYNTLGAEFKIDERFLSPANQRVTEELIDRIYNESGGIYNVKDIKRKIVTYPQLQQSNCIVCHPQVQCTGTTSHVEGLG